MLRRTFVLVGSVVLLGLSSFFATPFAAADTGGVTCPPEQPICLIVVDGPEGWVIIDVESPYDSLLSFLAQYRK